MEKGEGSSSSAAAVAGATVSAADLKKDNGSSILTKDQRIEKVMVIQAVDDCSEIRYDVPLN